MVATITALCSGIAGVISAVTALVIALRHRNDTGVHNGKQNGC